MFQVQHSNNSIDSLLIQDFENLSINRLRSNALGRKQKHTC